MKPKLDKFFFINVFVAISLFCFSIFYCVFNNHIRGIHILIIFMQWINLTVSLTVYELNKRL